MTTVKMTNAKALAFVLENCEMPEDVKERITAMANSYEKRANAPKGERKPTAHQNENALVKEQVLAQMENGVLYTISEMAKGFIFTNVDGTAIEVSPNRLSALVAQLKDDNLVIRTEDKRKAYFSLPTVDAE